MSKSRTRTDTKKKSIRTTVSIPAEDYAELELIAERKKVSIAWVVREAIDQFLNAESPLFRKAR